MRKEIKVVDLQKRKVQMKEIDISILSREPNNTEEVTLIIEPLAPLSMVRICQAHIINRKKHQARRCYVV